MSLTYAGEEARESAASSTQPDGLGRKLASEFQEAEAAKRLIEPRLLKCLRQYKGVYDEDVINKIKKGRAAVYIRHTAAKIENTKARLMDLLFPSNGALNWEIKPSPIPTVPPETVQAYLAMMREKGKPTPTDADALNFAVAQWSAGLMSQKISDQLMEPCGDKAYPRVCDRVIHSGLQYGTGILKGPLVARAQQQRYTRNADGSWVRVAVSQDEEYKPFFCAVSVWNFYPDPSAIDPDDLMYCWESHILTRNDFLNLGDNPGFRPDVIRSYIASHQDGDAVMTPQQREVRNTSPDAGTQPRDGLKGRYRILERWGFLNGEDVIAAGISEEDLALALPEGFDVAGTYASCIWMTQDGQLLKAALSPIEGTALPYQFYQPHKDESSFWAEGLADRIRDPQTAINAMARMTLDHASITTLPQIAVNVSALADGESATDFTAGKVWPFDNAEDMGEAMRMYEINSHINEIMAIGEKFSQWSDETSQPRYMTGDNAGVRGAGDTASGLSMLMSAASLPSKDMVRQFDALTEKFITNVYNWNMKFCQDERVKGDFDIIARGSTALIAQELQGQHMLQIMGVLGSPQIMNRVDWDQVLTHILRYLSLPDNVQLSDDAMRQKLVEQAAIQQQGTIEALVAQAAKNGIPPQVALQQIAQLLMHQSGGPGAPAPGGAPAGPPQGGPNAPSVPQNPPQPTPLTAPPSGPRIAVQGGR